MFRIKATAEEMQLAKEFMQKPPISFTYDGTASPRDFPARTAWINPKSTPGLLPIIR